MKDCLPIEYSLLLQIIIKKYKYYFFIVGEGNPKSKGS